MKRLISATLAALALVTLVAMPTMAGYSGDRDCDDFDSHAQAQAFFERHGGSESNNVDRLDGDGDGQACEDYQYSGSGDDGEDNGPGADNGEDPVEEDDGDLPDTATFGTDPASGLPVLLTALGLGTFGLMLRRRTGVRL